MTTAALQSLASDPELPADKHRLKPAPVPNAVASDYCGPDNRLSPDKLLVLLVADGVIGPEEGKRVGEYIKLGNASQHAYFAIASRRPKRAKEPFAPLEANDIAQWLGKRIGMPYATIDPVRVDFGRVAEVMSVQYATRFKILPIDSRLNEVTVATGEPFVIDWVAELKPLIKRDIKRVLANPADITRFIVEFFSVAKSIKDVQKAAGISNTGSTSIGNLEQLVDMGKGGKGYDANDQQVVQLVDWLWQYAFEQRASDIHLEPRREQGVVRFRIDGVLHNVYQVPRSEERRVGKEC